MSGAKKTFRFAATIKAPENGVGAFVEFPYDPAECFGTAGRIKVRCAFETEEYRGSLVKMGTACHIVGIRKEILARLGKKIGDTIGVAVEEDAEERTVATHPDLEKRLAARSDLRARYERLSYTKKKELNAGLAEAKKEETRAKRIDAFVSRLEAE